MKGAPLHPDYLWRELGEPDGPPEVARAWAEWDARAKARRLRQEAPRTHEATRDGCEGG